MGGDLGDIVFFLRVCIDFIWIDGKYMKISHVIENMIWKKR